MGLSIGTILFISGIAILLGITAIGAAAYTSGADLYPFDDGFFGHHGMHGMNGMHGGDGDHCNGEEAEDCGHFEEYCEEHDHMHYEDCPYHDEY